MSVVDLLVTLAIYGLVWYILWWAQSKIALPDPFGKVLTVVLVVAAVAILIGLLIGRVPLIHLHL